MRPPPLLDWVHTAIGEVFGPTPAQNRLAQFKNGGDGDFHQQPLATRRGLHADNTHITINGVPATITTYKQAHQLAQEHLGLDPVGLLIVHANTNHGRLRREFDFFPIPTSMLLQPGRN